MQNIPKIGVVIKGIVFNNQFIDQAIRELRKYDSEKADSRQNLKSKIQDEDGNVLLMETLLSDLNEVAGEQMYFGLNLDFEKIDQFGYGFWKKEANLLIN